MGAVLSRRERKLLRELHKRAPRAQSGRFLAEGRRVIEELLASPLRLEALVYTSSFEDSEGGQEVVGAAGQLGVRCERVDDRELSSYAATRHPQGVIAVARVPELSLDKITTEPEPAAVLLLDAVSDPGNLGTLVRTAEALGATGVITLPGSADAWGPKAVRASAGSTFRLPVVEAGWPEAAGWLRARGFRILAADAGGEPAGPELAPKTALAVGSEGAGLSAGVLRDADAVVGVRLRGRAESLNVAAAAAILLHHILCRS